MSVNFFDADFFAFTGSHPYEKETSTPGRSAFIQALKTAGEPASVPCPQTFRRSGVDIRSSRRTRSACLPEWRSFLSSDQSAM